jgi:CHASE3 domain sensor protein
VSDFLTISGAITFALIASFIFVFPLFAVLVAVGYFLIKDFNQNKEKYLSTDKTDDKVNFK